MLDFFKIKEISAAKGVLDIVIEKDYILDWLLWGISQSEFLRERMVFKGGTALHKMYFPDWRFSEDLDFTTTAMIKIDELKDAVVQLCNVTKQQSGISLSLKNIVPAGDEEWSFEVKIEYVGPRGQSGGNLPTVLLHITNDELLMDKPIIKKIIEPYGDLPWDFSILTYSLEEIFAEKMRSVLHQRCWARDVYDLWRLFHEVKNFVNTEKVIEMYIRKTQYRHKVPEIPAEITNRILRLENQWEQSLKRQIKDPPEFDKVQSELLSQINKFFEEYDLITKGGLKVIESHYVMRYKKGDFEIEVHGDKEFVEQKFKELLELKMATKEEIAPITKPIGEGKKSALTEFLVSKGADITHGDRILIFGYYLDKFENQQIFNIKDISDCYRKTRTQPTKNFSQYIAGLVRQGYLMDAPQKKDGNKAWQLTTKGMEYVEDLEKQSGLP